MSTLVSVRMEPPGPERDAPGSLRNSEVKILKVLSAICKQEQALFKRSVAGFGRVLII